VSALRLLSGVVLLSAIGASASHSHVGEVSSATHCLICQMVGLDLDSSAETPEPPTQAETQEDWTPNPPTFRGSSHDLPIPLPRGPPHLA